MIIDYDNCLDSRSIGTNFRFFFLHGSITSGPTVHMHILITVKTMFNDIIQKIQLQRQKPKGDITLAAHCRKIYINVSETIRKTAARRSSNSNNKTRNTFCGTRIAGIL